MAGQTKSNPNTRRTLILAAAALVVVLLLAVYFLLGRGAGEQRALAYVPADTALFGGSIEPVDMHKYLETLRWSAGAADAMQDQLEQLEKTARAEEPVMRFLLALYIDYLTQLRQGPDAVLARYGFGARAESAFYLVGAVPVLRMYLRDPAAFVRTLEAAEEKSGFAPTIESAGSRQERRYAVLAARADKPAFDLMIVVDGDAVAITLDASVLDDATRAVALGRRTPESSLSGATLARLTRAHGLNDDGIFYIDFVRIAQALVEPQGSALGRHVQQAFGTESGYTRLQTQACRDELPGFVAHVPRLVGGVTSYRQEGDSLEMVLRYDLEIANAAFVKSLRELRGVLPKHLLEADKSPVAWFGLGLNTGKFVSAVGGMVRDFAAQSYTCEPLLALQQSVTKQNLAGLAVVGMAQGAIGSSVAAYALDINAIKTGSLTGFDGIATLSAPDPMALWQLAAPYLPGVALPANGEAVDMPLPTGGTIKLALKGKHIVAYVGESGTQAAQRMSAQDLTPNGLFSYGYDYALLGQLVPPGEGAADARLAEMMKSFSGVKLGMTSDITESGWRNDITIRYTATASSSN